MAIGPNRNTTRLIPALQCPPRQVDHGHADVDVCANAHINTPYGLSSGSTRDQITELIAYINAISGGTGTLDHTLLLNIGTNTHAQLDTHLATSNIHFIEASIDHTNIQNIGSNSHTQIDSHMDNSTIHGSTLQDAYDQGNTIEVADGYTERFEVAPATPAGRGVLAYSFSSDFYIFLNADTLGLISDNDLTLGTTSGGIQFDDVNLTAAVYLSDASNTSFATTNQTIVGSINELHTNLGSIDHGLLEASSLLDDDHPGYLWGLGRSGGQTLYGDTDASGDLTLGSTAHATKGNVISQDYFRGQAAGEFTVSDAATNTIPDVLTVGHYTTSTPITGFGSTLRFEATADDSPETVMAQAALVSDWAYPGSGGGLWSGGRLAIQLANGGILYDVITLASNGFGTSLINILDDNIVSIGSSVDDAGIRWDTNQTNDALVMWPGDTSNVVIFIDRTYYGTNYGYSNFDDPTFLIHANSNVANQYLYLQHSGTAGRIVTGVGSLQLEPATFTGVGTGTPNFATGAGDLFVTDAFEVDGMSYLDGGADLNSQLIVDLKDPVSPQDAATKAYVDLTASGLDWQDSVIDKDLTAPPGGESTGDRYIVASPATGAWLGEENNIAEYNASSTWDFTTSNEGFATWVEDEDILYVFNGTDWVKFGSTITHTNLLGLTADDHTQYALLAGRATGQTLIGGTASGDDLTFKTTSDATKGDYIFSEMTVAGFLKNTVGGIVTGGNTIASGDITDFDEAAQDAIGLILTDTTTIDFTYDDGTPTISAIVIDGSISNTKLRDSSGFSVIGKSTTGTGDPADIVAGDETVLGRTGTGNLAFAQVATGQVADDAITFAKFQNLTTDRLIGRDTDLSGSPEEISVGGGLEFTGALGIQRSALTGDVTASAGSNSTTIAANAVSDAKLRDSIALSVIGRSANSVGDPADIAAGTDGHVLRRTSSVLGFGTIPATTVSDFDEAAQDAVGGILVDSTTIDFTYTDATPDITAIVIDDSISNTKLRNSAGFSVIGKTLTGSGDPADIVAGDETVLGRTGGGNLVFAQVATGQVVDDAITFAKMQNITTDRLIGRDTTAAGNPEEISVGGGLEFTGSAGIQRSALTGNVTASAGSGSTTIVANVVADTMLRDSAALSVIGRSANSIGDPADIVAAVDGDVLRRSGTTIGFGTIASSNISDFNEAAQDAVGTILLDTSSIDFTYTDGTPSIEAVVLPAGVDHNSLANLTTGDVHTQYHNDTRGDARYFQQSEFLVTSAGAGDSGKPVKLDADGNIDATMVNDGDIDHINISSIGANTHAQIDTHIGDGTVHFTVSSIDHGSLDATSLTHDDHSGYLWGLGRSGGQTLYGGSDAGDGLTLTGNPIDGGETTVGGNRLIAPAGLVSSPGVDVGGTGDGIFHDGFLKIVSGGATSLTIQDAKILCHDELEMQDNQQLQQGNAGDWRQTWSTVQTPDTAIMGLSASSMSLIIDVVGEWTKDHALPAQTYPTFAFFGGQDPTIYPNRYLTIGYDGANQEGKLSVAEGFVRIKGLAPTVIGTGTPSIVSGTTDLFVTNDLEVSGDYYGVSATYTGAVTLPLGAVGTPSLTFTGHTTDGLYHTGTVMSVAAAGVQTIKFSSDQTRFKQSVLVNDDKSLLFGTDGDSEIRWETVNNTIDTLVLGLDNVSRHMIICEKADIGTDWNRTADTNPTLYIQSADAATIADWVSFSHNQTDGVIATGAGGLTLDPASGTVNVEGPATSDASIFFWESTTVKGGVLWDYSEGEFVVTAQYDLKLALKAGTTELILDDTPSSEIATLNVPFEITVDDAVTNAVTAVATLAHTTSGTAADGIGTRLLYQAEDNGSTIDLAAIDAVALTVGQGSANGRLEFFVRDTDLTQVATLSASTDYPSFSLDENGVARIALGYNGGSALATLATLEIGSDLELAPDNDLHLVPGHEVINYGVSGTDITENVWIGGGGETLFHYALLNHGITGEVPTTCFGRINNADTGGGDYGGLKITGFGDDTNTDLGSLQLWGITEATAPTTTPIVGLYGAVKTGTTYQNPGTQSIVHRLGLPSEVAILDTYGSGVVTFRRRRYWSLETNYNTIAPVPNGFGGSTIAWNNAGTRTPVTTSVNGCWIRYQTASSLGSYYNINGDQYTAVTTNWEPIYQARIQMDSAITSMRQWWGVHDDPTPYLATDTPGSTYGNSCVMFRYTVGDTYWQAVTANGTTQTVVSTGVVVAASTPYNLEIRMFSGRSEFYINGILKATITATLPLATTALYPMFWQETRTSFSRGVYYNMMSLSTE